MVVCTWKKSVTESRWIVFHLSATEKSKKGPFKELPNADDDNNVDDDDADIFLLFFFSLCRE